MTTLPLSAVRTLHLAAQGLLAPLRRRATKDDVLATIRRMAQLQIDTIHVVARSPYLVLFSRLGPYAPEWLDEHLAEGNLFEYWSHEACFVPIEDFGLLCDEQRRRDPKRRAVHATDHDPQAPSLCFLCQRERFSQPNRFVKLDIYGLVFPVEPVEIGNCPAGFVGAERDRML